MKKGLVITLIIIIVLVCLSIPTKYEYKDGGTIEYKAVLWSYIKLHSFVPKGIKIGDVFYICGIKVKDTTKVVERDETVKEKKADTKSVETRYYQFSTESQEQDASGNPQKKYYEIKLNGDGTAETGYLRVLDTNDKKGVYTESDKYIIIALNNKNEQCFEGNYGAVLADSCTDTMVLIKDGKTLKYQRGFIYHFDIDNVNDAWEFKQVEKSDLQTSLKN